MGGRDIGAELGAWSRVRQDEWVSRKLFEGVCKQLEPHQMPTRKPWRFW